MLATILGFLFCVVCILLILIILLQRGRGGGLSGAFGGAGGHSAFGAKTGDVFTWITVGFVVVFLLLVVVLNYVMVPKAYEGGAPPTAPQTTAPAEQGADELPVEE